MKCEICGQLCKSYRSLGQHLKHIHNIKTQDYYDTYLKQNNNEGICLTCGKPTTFRGIKGGYSQYCSLKCANSNKDKCAKTVQIIRNKNNGGWSKIPEESKKAGSIKRHNTLVEHYGEDYASKIFDKGQEKRKQTKANWTDEKKQEILKKRHKTNMEKYGVINPLTLDENKQKANVKKHTKEADEKRKQTCKKHYGVDHQFKAKEVRDKIKQSNLDHYGVECSLSADEVKEKIRQTNLEKYGMTTPAPFGSEQFKQNMINKYGVENNMQVPEFKEKQNQTYIERYGGMLNASEYIREKSKQTSLEKYGTESPIQSEEIKEKVKQTNLERYGTENIFASEYGKDKIKETMLERYDVENAYQIPEVHENAVKASHSAEVEEKRKNTKEQNTLLNSELTDPDE